MNTREAERSGADLLLPFLRNRRIVVLSGAGLSTDSGIPDYRGPEGSLRTRTPMQFGEFIGSDTARARYWARSTIGWPRMAAAQPNAAHRALAAMEERGFVSGTVTQNVDGLHTAAGSRALVELHGSLGAVRCLGCDRVVDRGVLQEKLVVANSDWVVRLNRRTASRAIDTAPDGDVDLPGWALDQFSVPACDSCGGILKPDVVFFGESVPRAWVERAWQLYSAAEVLLVVGSSLTVYSGRRFIYRARDEGIPIVILNLGPTRGDAFAAAKLDAPLGRALPELARALSP